MEQADLIAQNIQDPEALQAAMDYLLAHPKARMFGFKIDGRQHIGLRTTYKRMTHFGELMGGKKARLTDASISFIQELTVWPKYDYVELSDEMLPGHVVQIMDALQVGNGFPSERDTETKNLYSQPGKASEPTTTGA